MGAGAPLGRSAAAATAAPLRRGAGAAASQQWWAASRMVSTTAQPITVARGDGIGPEIMESTLQVLKAAGANLAVEEIEVGEKLYRAGNTSGISSDAWESLRRTKVFLKAPITTPSGGGYKSKWHSATASLPP